jgi:SWI/SNF-related matrix-associated actin-dependent regulator 1 of chromatin subfamily A
MGLGKTCQVISFLSHLLKIGKRGPHLVVCPSSTLENWAREFQRFSPDLVFEVYHGSKQERDDLAQRLNDKMKEAEEGNEPVPVNVIITTYDIARKTGTDHRFLRTRGFKTAIFDEGHMLKNSSTGRYRMLMNIPAHWRLLMTGTPLQNNLQELVSVLAFIMPDMFSECKENLSYIFKYKAKTSEDDHAALFSKQRISRARSMMAPFILRRRKDQVLTDLPAKHTRIEYCDMTPVQKELYEEYAAEHQRVLAARAAGQKFDVNCNYLMLRRQAAVHPLLFRRHFDDGTVEKMAERVPKKGKYKGWSVIKTREWFEWYSDFQLHQLCQQHRELARFEQLNGDEWMDSGKVQKLVEILKTHVASGDRTLVFSQFTTVLDILEAVLATVNITFSRIDGAVSVAERQDLIDQFSDDESIQVFMLSTKAGGTGINLACANKVVIFDSSFNPHDDIQAENRAHRIGQKREVEVIRLITKGTIEEQIQVLGKSKLLLDERVSGDDENGDKVAKKAQELVEEMLLEKKEPEEVEEEAAKGDLKDLFAKGLRNAGVEVFS